MGTHGAAGARARALPSGKSTVASTVINIAKKRSVNLSDWPVARRLFAVIAAALVMGLVFGGLRVADSEGSASQFSRVSQLATLGQQLTVLVNDLQNERDETLLQLISGNEAPVKPLWAATHAQVALVQQAGSGIGGLPANIQSDLNTVLADIGDTGSKSRIAALESALTPGSPPQDEDAVIGNYDADISDMITLTDLVSQGVSDASLTSDVQALNALALAKEQASEQRGLIDYAIVNPGASSGNLTGFFNPNLNKGSGGESQDYFIDPTTMQTFSTAYDQEFVDEDAFFAAATPAEEAALTDAYGGARSAGVSLAENMAQNLIANNNATPASASSSAASVPGSPLLFSAQGLADPVTVKGGTVQTTAQVLPAWDAGQADKLNAMQDAELTIAGNISARASQLQSSASQSALLSAIITLLVLLIVLLAALWVARSLVIPLRRLRAGALDIASVQLPERVRLLTESPDAAASMQVAPISVVSGDEIGEVARAFDQVHSEAVRLAGEQALLRSSFNAMFVNLSRRSQTLIERLARMIDTLEQNEDDPDRLGSLFSMDHLVTRMRRNSENLLLLAGHENPRKWSESVPIADIARAATSEIEQYNRVTLNIPPGISVTGQAVSDVVHLLAELIENATIFSPKDTQVRVSLQELNSGGALIEVVDKGIGVSDARLTDMNWRLDNPPTIDVSVSRHMGLFAVASLAERHRVRVRLRPATPQGLSALIWLPDGIIERNMISAGPNSWAAQPVGARAGAAAGAGDSVALTSGGGSVGLATGYENGNGNGNGNGLVDGRTASGWFRGGQDGVGGSFEGGHDGAFGQEWSDPSIDGQTASGLPVRVPRANMPPGTGTNGTPDSQGGLPTRPPGNNSGPARNGVANDGKAMPVRSPERVRSRLSGFQRGTRRAEGQGRSGGSGGQAPRAGEGTER